MQRERREAPAVQGRAEAGNDLLDAVSGSGLTCSKNRHLIPGFLASEFTLKNSPSPSPHAGRGSA